MGSVRDGFNVVTGGFGYIGKYITRRLLAEGKNVKTLTNHPECPDCFNKQVCVAPLNFDDFDSLAHFLVGARVLFNTYWVRFEHGGKTFAQAVANTKKLIRAAEHAGVRRIVHVSIANPSLDSPLPYYRGKAEVEEAIRGSRLTYAILRPTVVFGLEDILINNIAWMLRRFPFFAIPGDGDYGVQPVFVGDLASLAVAAGERNDCEILDAVGPEIFTFNELVKKIAAGIGRRAHVVHVSSALSLLFTRLMGFAVRDVILTREEIDGLLASLLVSCEKPTCVTRFSDWLRENAPGLGKSYASELQRHYRGVSP